MKIAKPLTLFLTVILMGLLVSGCQESASVAATSAPPASVAEDNTVEEDTDGFEEGTSAADDIVNTTSAEKVLLVVSFGTSYNQSRNLTIGAIEAALKDAYPDYQVRRAFTSQIIIDKLAKRDNLNIDNVTEAMDRLVLDKVKEVIIQPTHVMSGFEYNDTIEEIMPYTDKFDSLKIGKPLLTDDIDYDEVAEAIVAETSGFRGEGTAIVYMGHGTEHEANASYEKLQEVLTSKGYDDYVIGTVEHGPDIDYVQSVLKDRGVKKVILRPLMVVAGDHANNDMAGDEEDSWKVILTEDGYEVEPILEGLGQVKGIQDIYIRHVQDAIDSDGVIAGAPAANASGIVAGRIKNGTYSIEVDSSTSMFRIVDCQLTVEDAGMTAVMTLSGQGFGKIYMGTGEDALKDSEENFHNFTDNGERHSFTVPVAALDRELDCAGFSIKKEEWYDHIVVFESANMPDDAFLPCEINVEMIGGSGKASVQSPTALTYKDGMDYATVEWSRPNFIYMIVDGAEYLPVNTDGNSQFEIPVTLDQDMVVVACTVAMSEPKEIEYTLRFDSGSIK